MLRRLLMSVLAAVVALAGLLAPGAAEVANAAGCAAGTGFAVDRLDFSPVAVPPGQLSTATLLLQNCTGQTITGSTTWVSRLTGPGPDLPPGCPALDPVGFPYSIAPGASATATLRLGDPIASCQATGLLLTVNVDETGVTNPVYIAQANLGIIQPAPDSCHVVYTPTDWPGGFTANVTITNTGTAAINGWTLGFTFPGDQTVTHGWNATVTQHGTGVTASNLAYDATIAPGASQSFGFQGTWAAADTPPTTFAVNGELCY